MSLIRPLARGAVALAMLTANVSAVFAQPGDMSVATFVTKADALEAKGPLAMFSGDLKTVIGEVKASTAAYRVRLAAERAAGHPSSCVPQPVKLDSDQLRKFLKAIPAPAQPRTTMRTAMANYYIQTYPCK